MGGPVRVYYQEVGRRLNAEVIFPPFFDVANAVGAATGVVAQTVTVTVEGDGSGVFRVHGPQGVAVFSSPAAALTAAEAGARQAAWTGVEMLGAEEPQLQVRIDKHWLPDAKDDSGLISARIVVEAVGRPNAAR